MHLKKLLLLLSTLALSACAATVPNTAQVSKPVPPVYIPIPMTPVPITCVNHTDQYIHSYAVQEARTLGKNMISALNCMGHEMGRSIVAAGYLLPKQWQPGMTVKVRWNRPIKGEDNWIEKTTTIKRYEKVGKLYVHFFANDEVRVVSSPYYPESSLHPILRNDTIAPPEEE